MAAGALSGFSCMQGASCQWSTGRMGFPLDGFPGGAIRIGEEKAQVPSKPEGKGGPAEDACNDSYARRKEEVAMFSTILKTGPR